MFDVGFIGWRGMVGSVLNKRMNQENDFQKIIPHFFSTSNVGSNASINSQQYILLDAYDIDVLAKMNIIVTTQGGEYTKQVYRQLRQIGWNGYWIDASSALRMDDEACIVLDPVNSKNINIALNNGIRTFVGGNCSITLAILGLAGLFRHDLVEWISIMTYQAASGAGARHVRELLLQNQELISKINLDVMDESISTLKLMESVDYVLKSKLLSTDNFGLPLVGNIIPWIDSDLDNGSSKEEWKGEVELNKILGLKPHTIKADGFCVRVGVVRCHSTAITLKLKKDLSVGEIEKIIASDNPWVKFIKNDKLATLESFTPASISESLHIHVGRLKKMHMEENLYGVMTIGDQLLWGAAEPLRRMLNILVGYNNA